MTKRFGKVTTRAYGVTYEKRQNKLWNVRKYMSKGYPIITMLRPEPNNPINPNAIAILVKTDATVAKIGYLAKDQAFWVKKKMNQGLIVHAIDGKVTGGASGSKILGFKFTILHEIAA